MTDIITPTTELEAVNTMLRGIGETPVSSLAGPSGLDVPGAQSTLRDVLRSVLIEGWQFNVEYDYPLNRNTAGEITVPSNALSVDIDRHSVSGTDPVIRGRRLYDRKNHTYKFKQNLKAKIKFGLSFELIPESGRHYVTYRAARWFADTTLGSSTLHQFNMQEEMRARANFISENVDDEDLNMIRDTPDFAHLR